MSSFIKIQFPKDFETRYDKYKAGLVGISKSVPKETTAHTSFQDEPLQNRKSLTSIHLITSSLEPKDVIFLVLDERFEMPIRYAVNNKNGNPAYIKKLYDIAYFCDAPNKKVDYSKSLADNINNGLFRRNQVAKYMKTNKFFEKPTLVQKSEDGKSSLVLKNEIQVQTGLIKHSVPLQFQSQYIDKTK